MRLLAFVLLLALSACDTMGDGPPRIDAVDPDQGVEVDTDALRTYREAWDAAGIEDYRLRYQVVCYCEPRVYDLRVVQGRIVEAWIDGQPVPEDPAFDVKTIDALYATALSAFDEADAVFVRVRPAAPALPVHVSIDHSREIADEEIGYRILGFERGGR